MSSKEETSVDSAPNGGAAAGAPEEQRLIQVHLRKIPLLAELNDAEITKVKGELRIRQLRERAERELGARFDVRAFHDQVIGTGALPLDVLEGKVERWLAGESPSPSGTQ